MTPQGHAADRLRTWIPRWWRGEAGVAGTALSLLLAPVELLFRIVVAARNLLFDRGVLAARDAGVPVISVGNLSVGGTGKTPVAAWLAARLLDRGAAPAMVTRGYGRDEGLLHHRLNPTVPLVANRDRGAACKEAVRRGCGAIVLDDGFQHRALARCVDIVLVAAEGWGERMRLLPRGPWREGTGSLHRADLVLVTRKTASREDAALVARDLRRLAGPAAVGICRIEPTRLVPLSSDGGAERPDRALEWLRGREVVAVATLADPRPFLEQLASFGARVEPLVFPDHHEFGGADLQRILGRSRDRPLVMTWKEGVKLETMIPDSRVAYVVEQNVVLEDGGEVLERLLERALGGGR
jgi:tetraacyldisaccharide 4'-kinase